MGGRVYISVCVCVCVRPITFQGLPYMEVDNGKESDYIEKN